MPDWIPATPSPSSPRVEAFARAADRAVDGFARRWLATANLLLLAWCSLAALAPVLSTAGFQTANAAIFALFEPLCHQRRDRSLVLFGQPMACCERCFAIYGGLALFGLAFATARNLRPLPRTGIFLLALPMALDVLGQTVGWRESTTLWRTITGLAFAVGVGWLAFPSLERGFADSRLVTQARLGSGPGTQAAGPPPAMPQPGVRR